MSARGINRATVAAFLADLPGTATDALAEARHAAKAQRWSTETLDSVISGITKHFAAQRDARLADRARIDAVIARLP